MVQAGWRGDAQLARLIYSAILLYLIPGHRRRAIFMVQIHSPSISGNTRRSKLALWATYHGLP
jgi:hypothetical protein